MNLEDKTPNDIEPSDPANQAASLANMTLKSPKPGTNGAKQKRPRKAADAMGGAAAKDKPAKGKSRKKALSFDDLAQATAAANVVSIAEARSGTDAGDIPPAAAPAEFADVGHCARGCDASTGSRARAHVAGCSRTGDGDPRRGNSSCRDPGRGDRRGS